MADIDVKYCLFKCFCLPLYGATLLQYEGKGINKLYIARRKSIRKLLNVSPRMHCDLLHEILMDYPFIFQLHKRMVKFWLLCSSRRISLMALKIAINGSDSVMCQNINLICYEYSLCKYDLLNQNVYIVLPQQEHKGIANVIRDFILYRDSVHHHDDENIICIINYPCEN